MVILLVLITFAVCIIVGMIVSSRKHPVDATTPAVIPSSRLSKDMERFFHPGHGWVLVHQPQLATIGIDDFTQRFVGRISSINLPNNNSVIHQGDPLVTLQHSTGKSVTIVSPLSGILAETNELLNIEPERVNASPYTDGWIAKIIPFNLNVELRNLMHGTTASMWHEALRMQLVQWFAPKLGPVLQDGGDFVENLNDLIPDKEWHLLLKEFFPTITNEHHHPSKT